MEIMSIYTLENEFKQKKWEVVIQTDNIEEIKNLKLGDCEVKLKQK